jgi:hypothetical protein
MEYNSLFGRDLPITEPLEVEQSRPTLPEFGKSQGFGLGTADFGLGGGSGLKAAGSYLQSDIRSFGDAEGWQERYTNQ